MTDWPEAVREWEKDWSKSGDHFLRASSKAAIEALKWMLELAYHCDPHCNDQDEMRDLTDWLADLAARYEKERAEAEVERLNKMLREMSSTEVCPYCDREFRCQVADLAARYDQEHADAPRK